MSKTLYTKCEKEDIKENVIFCGDPGRVKRIAKMLNMSKKISENREFVTYSGEYSGVEITITSTGIGGPSAAIAVEEMAECGMKVAIRIGTIMGLGETELGDIFIPVGCMRSENTSNTYVPVEYPAVADPILVQKMIKATKNNNLDFKHGLLCSYDGFYSEMKEGRLSDLLEIDIEKKLDNIEKYGIQGIDMESGVILTLSRLLGIKGGVLNVATVQKNLSSVLNDSQRAEAEQKLFTVVLDTIKLLSEEDL